MESWRVCAGNVVPYDHANFGDEYFLGQLSMAAKALREARVTFHLPGPVSLLPEPEHENAYHGSTALQLLQVSNGILT